MARFKVLELSYIGEKLVEAGEEVEITIDMHPGPNLEPLDKAAEKMVRAGGISRPDAAVVPAVVEEI